MEHSKARLSLVLSAALVFDSLALSAQEGPAPLVEVLDVRVTSVEVVVTGPDGRPAAGLTRADFEILENGKPQPISNFYEVGGAGPAAGTVSVEGIEKPVELDSPRSARKFIFYFDNGSLSIQNRNAIFPATREFLARAMEPGDQAMIATWNRELTVRLPWSSDQKAVDAVLRTMAEEPADASVLQAEKRRVERALDQLEADAEDPKTMTSFAMLETQARTYAENVRNDVSQSVAAASKLLSSLSGVDGRKVLVLATESLPTVAGGEMFEKIESIRTRAMVSTTSTLKPGATRGSRVEDLSKFTVAPMIEQLGNIANATGVTIYALNPKASGRRDAGTSDLQMTGDTSVDFAESVQGMDGVGMLARKTGGVAMVGAPAHLVLARIEADLGSYYSLGYRAEPGGSPNRDIQVRVKRPGHSVRARTSVYYRSLETEMADRVIANHLQASLPNELGISLEADPVTSGGQQPLLPMRIVIPVDSLTLLPVGDGKVTGGFSVFVCSGDGKGDASGVNVQSHRIDWPAGQAEQMKGRRIGFAVQVPVVKGREQISVGVVDHLSQIQGFATLRVGQQG